jgi:CheY-like chemotaxis protein
MAKKILVIDDDHLVVKSLARLLEQEGYSVSCAENSNQALDLIGHVDFDLIISDIRMPGMNGIETTNNIRDVLRLRNKETIPIIFITGYSDETSYNEAKKLNAADFIYKPFDKDKFLQSIKNTLRSQ